jgi:acetolactate synthase-1/2/3 large subunit
MSAAFRICTSNKPGPVHIDLPADVLLSDIEFDENDYLFEKCDKTPYKRFLPSAEELDNAVELILNSDRITIIAGAGIFYSQAIEELLEFSEMIGAAVATTPFGKGCFPETHPLSIGVASTLNNVSSKVLESSDLVILIGTKTDEFSTDSWQLPLYDKKVIHIDIDPEELGRNYPITLGLLGDAKETLRELIRRIKYRVSKLNEKKSAMGRLISELISNKEKKIDFKIKTYGNIMNPFFIIKELERTLPKDAIITGDASSAAWWLVYLYKIKSVGRLFLRSSFGSIGTAFPFAIGSKIAQKNKVVVGLGGDGGFGMSLHELETAKRLHLPVIYIVLNDSVLGWTLFDEKGLGFNKDYSVSFSFTEFDKIARAFGCNGIAVSEAREFGSAIKDAINTIDVPTVIDVRLEPFYPPKELRNLV